MTVPRPNPLQLPDSDSKLIPLDFLLLLKLSFPTFVLTIIFASNGSLFLLKFKCHIVCETFYHHSAAPNTISRISHNRVSSQATLCMH